MDLADLPAYLEALSKAAAGSAAPAANAMADAVRHQIQHVALKQVAHGPGMFWKAAPMRPPAYVTGNLSRSIMMRPAYGSVRGTATVVATAEYAALQEFGGDTWPSHSRYMHWVNTGGAWYMKRVTVPPHPFFRPSVEQQIRTGNLSMAAYQAFWVRVLPYLRLFLQVRQLLFSSGYPRFCSGDPGLLLHILLLRYTGGIHPESQNPHPERG